jgi:uncharacterized damage-inducible protein DinB
MPSPEIDVPPGHTDERELLLSWLAYERGAVLRKAAGVSEEQARWRPEGRLIALLGIVHHLTQVEWRWIDGGFRGQEVSRTDEEFEPGPDMKMEVALAAYRARAAATDAFVRSAPSLGIECQRKTGTDLRWVLLHLINETARHAGHADAVREMLDGTTGE